MGGSPPDRGRPAEGDAADGTTWVVAPPGDLGRRPRGGARLVGVAARPARVPAHRAVRARAAVDRRGRLVHLPRGGARPVVAAPGRAPGRHEPRRVLGRQPRRARPAGQGVRPARLVAAVRRPPPVRRRPEPLRRLPGEPRGLRGRAGRPAGAGRVSTFAGIPRAAVTFYAGLEADNSREFWAAHKEIYE